MTFEEEEKELEGKLAAVRKKKEEAELNKSIILRIRRIAGAFVFIHADFRKDMLALLQQIPGRIFSGGKDQENAIPVGAFSQFIESARSMKNVTIVYNQGVEKEIHDYLFAPPYTVALENEIVVQMNRTSSGHMFSEIPGIRYFPEKKKFTFPRGEGWRFHEIIEKDPNLKQSVVYEGKEIVDFIAKQLEDRFKIDNIALSEDIPDFPEVPGLQNVVLRNFQKVGAWFITKAGGSGLIADEMGLGKTLQAIVIALLGGGTTLIVCPASLKTNWVREILRFTGLQPYILQGTTPSEYDLTYIIAKKPKFVIINYDVIGRGIDYKKEWKDAEGRKHESVSLRFPWIEALNICNFTRCILDESHYIKNVDSQRSIGAGLLKAKNIIALTGTPVLNRPGEYWRILNMLRPDLFPFYTTFLRQYTWNGKEARNVDQLRNLLKPIMIRRLKKDVIKELPAINRINDYHELTPKARKLYEKVLNGVYELVAEWSPVGAGSSQKITNILTQIMRMKQVVAIDMIPSTADLATEIYDSTSKKVLIFSQFKPTTFGICARLGNEALGFVDRLPSGEFNTVDEKERMARIDQFQNDPNIHFLVVTEKTAKEGYNITAAEVVIFNDLFWTPAGHQQAEGRSYGRLSNLHPIDSYYRIGVDSISEWIMDLLAAKLNIIEEVVEGVQKSRTNVSESVFMELIKTMKEGAWRKRR